MNSWNRGLLNGKRFTDGGGTFQKILKISNSYKANFQNETVCEVMNVKDLIKKDRTSKKYANVYRHSASIERSSILEHVIP